MEHRGFLGLCGLPPWLILVIANLSKPLAWAPRVSPNGNCGLQLTITYRYRRIRCDTGAL